MALEHRLGVLVALKNQTRPLTPVYEEVVEPPALELGVLHRVDQDQLAPQPLRGATRQLQVSGIAELTGCPHEPHGALRPTRDVLPFPPGGQDHVDPDHQIQALVVDERLSGKDVDDAAVRVEVIVHAHRLDEQRQGDRDPDELADRELGCELGAEGLEPPLVDVVDD
jgi:hypothetical protein